MRGGEHQPWTRCRVWQYPVSPHAFPILIFTRHVLRLRLGNVDNGARHAANQDHASGCLALHEMARDRGSKQVSAVDIDSPQFAQAINRIVDGLVILSEAGRCNEVVNLAMLFDDFGDTSVDRGGVRDV